MKVLFTDLLTPHGHRNLNRFLIRLLKRLAFVEVAMPEKYFKLCGLENENVVYHKIPECSQKVIGGKIGHRLKNIRIIRWLVNNVDLDRFDAIFVSSFETMSFFAAWPRNLQRRVLLLNHNNLDELVHPLKRTCYKNLARTVEHIVLEEFMKDYLISEIGIVNPVWVIHHPVTEPVYKVHAAVTAEPSKIVFAPSNSNDEDFVRELVWRHKHEKFLRDLSVKVIIKSKRVEYQDDYLEVSTCRWSDSEYREIMKAASIILLPYPRTFVYRVSGVLFDCVAYGKKFLSSRNVFFERILRRYPGLGVIFDGFDDFVRSLSRLLQLPSWGPDFAAFYKDYSERHILKEVGVVLGPHVKRGAYSD